MIDILSRQLALKASTQAAAAISQMAAISSLPQAIVPTVLGAIGDGAHAVGLGQVADRAHQG